MNKDWIKYWKERDIDWAKSYVSTWQHPHRRLIVEKLKEFTWHSLYELGTGGGANLHRIQREFPNKEVGGMDINEDSIKTAKDLAKHLRRNWLLQVDDIHDLFMGDDACDVILTDMALIYVAPQKIKALIKDLNRIARIRVIFVEFHHSSWWKRQTLRFRSGYHAHNYKKLLLDAGFHDIQVEKIKEEDWPKGEPQKTYGYIISASV